jgi:hippurate hydrolase
MNNHMRRPLLTLIIVFSNILPGPEIIGQHADFISANSSDWLELYKELHASPELSFHEVKTAVKMAEVLRKQGFEVTEQLGGNGVVGVLNNGSGPTIMVRTDMDALPVIEETGLPYASTVTTNDDDGNQVGVMHACGHDLAMTTWAATAELLAQHKDQWKGTLVFIAQPAEERSGGATSMLDAGLYEKFPVPDYALAFHSHAALASGNIGYVSGYAMANVDFMKVTIFGEGGHGAYPHTTKDPIVLAAKTILDLQTIVSREISPLEPAVVTVGKIAGGTKGNIIPDKVELELTMRSYSDEVKVQLIEKIKRICIGNAKAAGIPEDKYPEFWVRPEDTPSLYNDPELTSEVSTVLAEKLGSDRVIEVSPVMAGEDFSEFGRTEHQVPVCLLWLGAVAADQIKAAEAGEIELPSLHSSKFAPLAEPAIQTGVEGMSSILLHLLNK